MFWLESSMSRQQEFICGLSHEVTIAVLPRLNMKELIFELNRRIQYLDKENSIKNRLVSILRDMMLEEYRQWERNSEVSSLDETTIFGKNQETATMQENVLTACTETMVSQTASPDASQQSSGLEILIKKESDTSSEMLMHAKERELDTKQAVPQQDELCNMPSLGSPTIPSYDTSMIHINNTTDPLIKEEDFAISTEDEDDAGRPCHDELNVGTSTFSTHIQVQDTLNSMNTSYSETPLKNNIPREEAPLASCHLLPDHGDVHMKIECHMSQDDQNGQISQPSNPDQTEHYTDDRDIGLTNNGHEQSRKDSSEETPLASCQPIPDQDCKNMSSLRPDNASQIGSKRYVCELETSFVNSSSKHRKRNKEEKPYMCDECGYRAYRKCRLVEHIRTHTGEKPFKCNHCNYKTSFKQELSYHMKRHTDTEPYRCEICDYKTYRKPCIEKHIMCHSGVKPYKCKDCDYSTSNNSHLSRHRRRHTGEKPLIVVKSVTISL
ncbi:zinc finger protein 37-like [Branchiostoma floridae]|uniref:Zinc finger protein 37-like n=1 Tax=Branchiostoma floridae TaxID=7739 RepID=A0A9J7LSC3_BRAFL|nr:zinc finger protein 37-like [Branchiostoma floridae]